MSFPATEPLKLFFTRGPIWRLQGKTALLQLLRSPACGLRPATSPTPKTLYTHCETACAVFKGRLKEHPPIAKDCVIFNTYRYIRRESDDFYFNFSRPVLEDIILWGLDEYKSTYWECVTRSKPEWSEDISPSIRCYLLHAYERKRHMGGRGVFSNTELVCIEIVSMVKKL